MCGSSGARAATSNVTRLVALPLLGLVALGMTVVNALVSTSSSTASPLPSASSVNVTPPLTMIWAWALFDEPLTIVMAIGSSSSD